MASAVGIVIGVTLASAAATAAGRPTVQASAGVGGVTKAGRWTPVSVVVNTPEAMSGVLHVSWGTFSLRREFTLASAGDHRFELYARTSEVEAAVRVRVASNGTDLRSIDVPVRVLQQSELVTLCVVPVRSLAGFDPACTVAVTSDRMPGSLRGYDAVDRVVWMTGERALAPDQRSAFERWSALRDLDDAGDLSVTSQVSRPILRRGMPTATAWIVAGFTGAFAAMQVLVGFVGLGRRRLSHVIGLLSVLTLAATVGAAAVGRVGPARAVHVHHNSLLQQIPGASGSVLTMKGVVEFPAFDAYSIRFPLTDALLESASPSAGSEQVIDQAGYPVVAGVFGLGERQAFAVEAVTDLAPLEIEWNGPIASVTNRSEFVLRSCAFGDGFSAGEPGDLRPGAAVSAQETTDVVGPMFTCLLRESPVAFTAASRPVASTGATTIALYRRTPPSDETLEARHE
jgi:hypothetical protein